MSAVESHGPGEAGTIMIWESGESRPIRAQWGLRPFEPGGRSYTLLRSEGRTIERPCLIIAHEIIGKTEAGKPYRASLITDAPSMFLAGIWQPAHGAWADAFAALTVEAYPDIAPYKERHIAVIRQEHLYDWLQRARPVAEMLRPFPAGSFTVTGSATRTRRTQASLFG